MNANEYAKVILEELGRTLPAISAKDAEKFAELVMGANSIFVAGAGRSGKPFRVYYTVQVGANPIMLRLFVNDTKRLPANYEQFIINSLRAELGLEGAVVRLQFRPRPRSKNADAN